MCQIQVGWPHWVGREHVHLPLSSPVSESDLAILHPSPKLNKPGPSNLQRYQQEMTPCRIPQHPHIKTPSVFRPESPLLPTLAPPHPHSAVPGPNRTILEPTVPRTLQPIASAHSWKITLGNPIPHTLALPAQPTSSGSQSITIADLTIAMDRQQAQVMKMMRIEWEEQRKQRERECEEQRWIREAEHEEDWKIQEAELKMIMDREDACEKRRQEEEAKKEKRRQEERDETMRLFSLLAALH